jgi:hypothetical protein
MHLPSFLALCEFERVFSAPEFVLFGFPLLFPAYLDEIFDFGF